MPEETRSSFAAWGFCADEFDTEYTLMPGFPHELYQRDVPLLEGQQTVTYYKGITELNWRNQICVIGYVADAKAYMNLALPTGGSVRFGHIGFPDFFDDDDGLVDADGYNYFGIPMGAVLPPKGVCDNLIVSVGLSASRLASTALRLEPGWAGLGEACGHMMLTALDKGVDPALLEYGDVLARLNAANAITHIFPPEAA